MIVRAKRRQNFTVINNTVLNDDRLSFRAKGVLAFILAKPDDWAISERSLAQEGPDGRSAVASALTELEAAGYLQRRRVRNADGTIGWDSTVFDEPQTFTEAQEIAEETTPETAGVDHSDPGGGSQRSTVDGKTSHGFTIHGKSSHIIKTEQLRTNTDSSIEESGAAAPAATTTDDDPPAWYEAEPEPQAPAPAPTAPAPTAPAPTAPAPTVKAMTANPVIAMYRDAFLRYPSKPQMAYLLAAGVTDLRRWQDVLTLWVGKGWSITNLAGMIDLYQNPERIRELTSYQPPAPATRQPAKPPAPTERVAPGWHEWLEELNPTGAHQ